MRPLIYVPALALLAIASLHCNRDEPKTDPAAPLSIPLELPKAATGKTVEQASILISINAKGQLYVGADLTRTEALVDLLKDLVKKKGDLQAVIQADRSVPHGRVVEIIDSCRTAGIKRYSLGVHAIKRPPEPRPAK